ncbi:hypothetical protein K504DRAFT_378322 [Pleomassaria siparia CBS 279.74]|uniref:Uncharacterized protein n=1 Tax=Pleomassaria siparia CBS 279.74 TaxID=1314801 RepID=A0A6G1KCC2_9PLEO|nr:hypothetical protein K504DRAFT_378322 [Pleomassaria siparia CBS 279.74]
MCGNAGRPANFDPYKQHFKLLMSNGTELDVNMAQIDFMRLYGIRLGIEYGSQIGASFVLLAMLLLLTRREKRKSLIFVTNIVCLLVNAVRCICYCLYLTGNWFNPFLFLSDDFSRITTADTAQTIATTTMTTLLYICVMVSLSLQVWIVCITTQKNQRILIMGGTTVIALLAVGVRFAVTVISNQMTMINRTMSGYGFLLNTNTVLTTAAIWVYCCVFTFKLGIALMQRRRLGLVQFGPMQIIFIMGCQTMVVPAIFSCLQFYDRIPELGSFTPTIVCISLPLSAIWAGIATNDSHVAASGADAHQRLLRAQFGRTQSTSGTDHSTESGEMTRSSTLYTKDLNDPDSPTTTFKEKGSVESQGIQVQSDWRVDSGEPSSNYSTTT